MFVVEPTGAQAVVEWAEELVEQSPLGLAVPISCGATGERGAQRGQPRAAIGSMPTGIRCQALSPAWASCTNPTASSLTRPRATTRPSTSMTGHRDV